MRPLRLIKRNVSLRIAIDTLLESMKAVGSLLVIMAMTIMIFSIIGVSLFGGQFWHCTDPNFPDDPLRPDNPNLQNGGDCEGNYNMTNLLHPNGYETLQREWVNADLHFDDFGAAAMTLFVVMIGDSWDQTAIQGSSSAGVDIQPKIGGHSYSNAYFAVFIGISSLLLLKVSSW